MPPNGRETVYDKRHLFRSPSLDGRTALTDWTVAMHSPLQPWGGRDTQFLVVAVVVSNDTCGNENVIVNISTPFATTVVSAAQLKLFSE